MTPREPGAHPLLEALERTLRALEGRDPVAAASALAPAVERLGRELLEPQQLADARQLQRRCEHAAATLQAQLRGQLDAFGRSRRAQGAYGQG